MDWETAWRSQLSGQTDGRLYQREASELQPVHPQRDTVGARSGPGEQGLPGALWFISVCNITPDRVQKGDWSRARSLAVLSDCPHLPQAIVQGCEETKASEAGPSTLPCPLAVQSLQWCPTLRDPVDCSPPGSSAHGILQAGVLQWAAMASSRGSCWLRDQNQCLPSPALAGRLGPLEGLPPEPPLTSCAGGELCLPWHFKGRPADWLSHQLMVLLIRGSINAFCGACESVSCSVLSGSLQPLVPLSIEFSRQVCWSGLPFLCQGHLPDIGSEPRSPALEADNYHLSHQASPFVIRGCWQISDGPRHATGSPLLIISICLVLCFIPWYLWNDHITSFHYISGCPKSKLYWICGRING